MYYMHDWKKTFFFRKNPTRPGFSEKPTGLKKTRFNVFFFKSN